MALATTMTISGKADKEWTAVGCRELLAAGDPAAPLVPGKRGRCTRCADVGSKGKVGRCTQSIPWSFQEHPTEAQERMFKEALNHYTADPALPTARSARRSLQEEPDGAGNSRYHPSKVPKSSNTALAMKNDSHY